MYNKYSLYILIHFYDYNRDQINSYRLFFFLLKNGSFDSSKGCLIKFPLLFPTSEVNDNLCWIGSDSLILLSSSTFLFKSFVKRLGLEILLELLRCILSKGNTDLFTFAWVGILVLSIRYFFFISSSNTILSAISKAIFLPTIIDLIDII